MRDGRIWAEAMRAEIHKAVVGQDHVIDRLLVALLANGHVLLEGLPGLAKTLLVRSLAAATGLDFERIQFTPDLLPSDVIGTMVFQPGAGEFKVHLGPVFANLVLADEINRAPAKVQSALLEGMQERQVTLGGRAHALPSPFLVMATQNPLEQEGTYPLPEAQIDRFLFKLLLTYPAEDEEREMMNRWGGLTSEPVVEAVTSGEEIHEARRLVEQVFVSEELQGYMLALVRATRELARTRPGEESEHRPLAFGASPRASLALIQSARALAWIRGMDYADPGLVQELLPDVLRHRIGLTYEAEADELSPESILEGVAQRTVVPRVG